MSKALMDEVFEEMRKVFTANEAVDFIEVQIQVGNKVYIIGNGDHISPGPTIVDFAWESEAVH